MKCNGLDEYPLSYYCIVIGGGTPKTSVPEYWGGNIPWISIKDIVESNNIIENTEKTITEEGLNNSSTKILDKGDIIISARGTVGKIALISKPMAFNQSCFGIKVNRNVDPVFFYYVLVNSISTIKKNTQGSVFDTITAKTFDSIRIAMPTFEVQRRIGSFLSSIDSQINANMRINDYLLKLGEAIFDYYQEDADVSCTINDLAEEIVCGKTPSTSYKEYYGEDIPFITIPDLHNSPVIVRTERYLSNIGAETQKKKTLPAHSICVSCIATPGLVSLTSELSQTNQQINSIICKKSIPPLYVYYLMRSSSDVIINLGSSGSATLNLNKTQFSQIKINILAPIEMLNFNNETKYILQLIELNSKTNVILESLRDMLLPLLMSGEIDVSKLDLGS